MFSKTLQAVGRPITYFPAFAKAFGDLKTGVFLSNFLYWEGKQSDVEGWIYKTQKGILDETGLSRKEQEYARKKLKELNCLIEKRQGVPAKLYYKFDWEEVDKFISQSLTKLPEKKKVKVEEIKEEREPTLVYQFKEIFDIQFAIITEGEEYQWSTESGGGKDWKHIKLLSQCIEKRTKNRLKRDPSKEEILDSFKQWIEKIPKWYEYNAFSPSVLYSKFNEITAAIIQEYKKQGSSEKPKDFSSWLKK